MRHLLRLTPLLLAGTAFAQAPHTRPDQIVCAISGSCDTGTAASDRQIPVGQEKSFSLVRPGAAPTVAPATSHTAATHAGVGHAAARRTAYAAHGVRPAAGRIEMRVSFPKGSSELTPDGRQEAQNFATAMATPALAGMHFKVEGHTDAVGSRAYNEQLSQRRAQSVVDYLSSLGVDRSRLDAQGYGFDRPRPGTSPRDPSNRRVEFVKAG